MKAPLVFKARYYGDLSSQCRIPRLGSPIWGSDPLLHRGHLHGCDIPPAYGSPHQWCGYWLDHVSTPLTHLNVVFSLYLYIFVAENLFCRDSCSICSCSFGVSMGRSELRIFLLCYLDPDLIKLILILKSHIRLVIYHIRQYRSRTRVPFSLPEMTYFTMQMMESY